MMRRGIFFAALAAGLFNGPVLGRAQSVTVPRISVLGSHDDVYWDAFRQGLGGLGYVEGRTIKIEYRWSQNERFADLAAELVHLNVDIIVTWGTPAALAAKQATATIPIVMASSGNPVGTGIVASLARPGGNITGSASLNPDLEGKRLELLKEIVPNLSRVAVLSNPQNPLHRGLITETHAAARPQKLGLQLVAAEKAADLEHAFALISGNHSEALVILPDHFFLVNGRHIADLALKARLPAVSTQSIFAHAGGLFAYGVHYPELFRNAATYVDKILKGAKPGDLPVQQATRFELVLNLKTARALGLTIPPTLLVRADEVIE